MKKSAWNKGRKWPEATKKRISESRKGIPAWNKNKPWAQDVIDKISKSKKGSIPWNKNRSWPLSVRKKISRSKLAITLDLKPFFERNRPSKRLKALVLQRDNFKCRTCGKSSNEVVLEAGHIVPVSKGGKTILENLIAQCLDCNRGFGGVEIKF